MSEENIQRIRTAGPRVNFVAGATPATVFILSNNRVAYIRKILAYNGQAADIILEIGTGLAAAFARAMPRFRVIAGFPFPLSEEECPRLRFEGNITAQVSAAGAGALSVEVQVEVEEE